MSIALLDTQALLWFLDADARLSDVAIRRITEPGAELFFSYASVWEITIRYANGKLALPAPPEAFLATGNNDEESDIEHEEYEGRLNRWKRRGLSGSIDRCANPGAG